MYSIYFLLIILSVRVDGLWVNRKSVLCNVSYATNLLKITFYVLYVHIYVYIYTYAHMCVLSYILFCFAV